MVYDYYKLFNLTEKYTTFQLLWAYISKIQFAISKKDQVLFVNATKGFEVLRDKNLVQDYNRLYKKYLIGADMHVPKYIEEFIFERLNKKEAEAESTVGKSNNKSFFLFICKFSFALVAIDLLQVVYFILMEFTMSGLLIIGIGIYLISTNNDIVKTGLSLALILFGFVILRRNILSAVITNE